MTSSDDNVPGFFDTCVLFKPYVCDTVLTIADAGLYRPLWSADVLTELDRNLRRCGRTDAQVAHRLARMTASFLDAEVVGYERLIDAMTNDKKDRHVLAAAVRGGAEVLVTENIKDFPAAAVAPYDIVAVHQDDFLLDQLDLVPAVVLGSLRRQVSRYRREPRTVGDLLEVLVGPGQGCPRFAAARREWL